MKLRPLVEPRTKPQLAAEAVGEFTERDRVDFDPRRDVPKENRRLWKERAEKKPEPGWEAVELYRYKLLFPDEPLNIKEGLLDNPQLRSVLPATWLSQVPIQEVASRLDSSLVKDAIKDAEQITSRLGAVAVLQVFFPDQVKEMRLDIDKTWEAAREDLCNLQKRQAHIAILTLAAWTRLVFPDRLIQRELTVADFEGIRTAIEDTWAAEREHGQAGSGLDYTFYFYVLSADEAKITATGIEVKHKQQLRASRPLPSRTQA